MTENSNGLRNSTAVFKRNQLEAIYEDSLEGRISKDLYDRKSHDLRTQSLEVLGRINEMRASAPAPVEDAISLMDLTGKAAEIVSNAARARKAALPEAGVESRDVAGWPVMRRIRDSI